MKILGLNTFNEDGKRVVGVTVEVDGPLLAGIAQVVNAIEGPSRATLLEQTAVARAEPAPTAADLGIPNSPPGETKAQTSAQATTTRRTRAAPAATTTEPATETPPSGGERRRRQAAPAATEPTPAAPAGPRVITDADLSKAASNGAATLTPPVVTSILGFYDAGTTNDLKPMAREAWLSTLNTAIQAHAVIGNIVGAVAADVEKLRSEDASLDAAVKFLSELDEEIKLAEAEKAAAGR